MPVAPDSRHLTKTLLGVSLVAAPLCILVGSIVGSAVDDGDDMAAYLASVDANAAAHYIEGMLGAIGSIFLVAGVLALVHLVRARHPRFAYAAGGLALVCVTLLPGVWLMSTVVDSEMARSADQAAMARLLESSDESATIIPLFVAWIGMSVGILALSAGLAWSRTVPLWMPAVLALAIVVLFVSGTGWTEALASALMLVGFGSIGVAILRSPVEAWQAGDLVHHEPAAPAPPAAALAVR